MHHQQPLLREPTLSSALASPTPYPHRTEPKSGPLVRCPSQSEIWLFNWNERPARARASARVNLLILPYSLHLAHFRLNKIFSLHAAAAAARGIGSTACENMTSSLWTTSAVRGWAGPTYLAVLLVPRDICGLAFAETTMASPL